MLSQTMSVTVRLKVVAMDPSKEVVASRLGRNTTPSGVVMESGTQTSTQAIAPSLEQAGGADATGRRRGCSATVVSSHSPYWCMA